MVYFILGILILFTFMTPKVLYTLNSKYNGGLNRSIIVEAAHENEPRLCA